jgi:predicted GIY-YIG superfamily endonuclease
MSKSTRAKPKGPWTCYALTSKDKTRSYTGQTNNFSKRLRQHNGEISGGARYTKTKTSWSPLFRVTQFKTLRAVLQFEIAMKKRKVPSRFDPLKKHYTKGPKGRVRQLEYILSLGRLNGEKESVFTFHPLEVIVHIQKEKYIKWAGLTWGEFKERRQNQGINFVFI